MHRNSTSDSSPVSLEQVERQLGNSLWYSMMVSVCVLSPISLLRALGMGWLPLYTIHATTLVIMVMIHLLRARFPISFRKVLALAYIFLMGCQGLYSMGVLGFGGVWLSLTCYLVGMVYGMRAGIACVLLGAALMGVAMFQFTHGIWQVPVDAAIYVRSTGAWALALAMMLVMPTVLLGTIVMHKQAIVALLHETERQRLEIECMAMHDPLTGLVLHAVAKDRLQMALNRAQRDHDMVGLLFIDLDGFKQVNDQLGHGEGDRLLRMVAKGIQREIRSGDTAARMGGDEFLVVLEGLNSREAVSQVANRLTASISGMSVRDGAPTVGASIGIALFPEDGVEVEALVHAADLAMYEAKRHGKGGVAHAVTGRGGGVSAVQLASQDCQDLPENQGFPDRIPPFFRFPA